MSTTATGVIYTAAGAPPMPGSIKGTCCACGAHAIGVPFAGWVRDTFTDHDKLTAGEICCHACQFCFTDRNESLTRMLGRDKPQRMRNYSHFVVQGIWTPLSKGDKSRMRELLALEPEVAIIATSGQKHIAFRAQSGWWQIEEHSVRPFPRQLASALALIEPLYRSGISKAEIESGRYSQKRILDFGLSAWRDAEAAIKHLRGSPYLELALFLVQRDGKDDDDTRTDSE